MSILLSTGVTQIEKPRLYRLEDGLYALLYHPDTDKKEVAALMQNYAIMPECEREKQRNIAAEVAKSGHIQFSQPSQPSVGALPASPHPSQEEAQRVEDAAALEAAQGKLNWFVHSADGEYNNLEAAVKVVSLRNKRKGIKCIENKLPAGSSFIRSMNDVAAHMHSCLHDYFGSADFKFQEFYPMPHGATWATFFKDLKALCKPDDFDCASEAFKHMPTAFSKACTRQNIMDACFKTGILSLEGLQRCEAGLSTDPSDLVQIMSAHPHWHDISTETAEQFRDVCHPIFVDITGQRGYIPEGERARFA